jgi:hypothetical protein
MRLLRYRGLMVLVIWQAAPIGTVTDETGRSRIAVGYGAGQFENVRLDCEGNPIGGESVPASSAGVQFDTWLEQQVLLSASLSHVAAGRGDLRFGGLAGSALVSWEGRRVGLGTGVALVPIVSRGAPFDDGWYPDWEYESTRRTFPTAYVRIGEADGVHFRADFLAPSPALPMLGELRAGFGFGHGRSRRVGGFAGLAATHFATMSQTQTTNGSAFAEVSWPVGRSLDLEAGVLLGPGSYEPNLGARIGGRVHLGRPGADARADRREGGH